MIHLISQLIYPMIDREESLWAASHCLLWSAPAVSFVDALTPSVWRKLRRNDWLRSQRFLGTNTSDEAASHRHITTFKYNLARTSIRCPLKMLWYCNVTVLILFELVHPTPLLTTLARSYVNRSPCCNRWAFLFCIKYNIQRATTMQSWGRVDDSVGFLRVLPLHRDHAFARCSR